jgi:Actin like proteins N terminal domain
MTITDEPIQRTDELAVFCLDGGYGHVKAAYDSGNGTTTLFRFPSIVLPVEDYPHHQYFHKAPDLVKTGVKNQFLSGEDLFQVVSPGIVTPTHDNDFCRQKIYKQLVTAALHRQPFNKIKTMVLALPLLTYMLHKESLAEMMQGDYVINEKRTVYVHSVVVRVQGVAAVQATVNPELTPFIIGLDLGSHTLDIVSVIDSQFVPEKCKSLPNGMNDLVAEIIARLNRDGNADYNKSAMHNIRRILVTNKKARFGNEIYDRTMLLALAPRYVESLRYIAELYTDNQAKLALLGGGAGVLNEIMRKHQDRFLPVDNSDYANAIGMKAGV